MCASTLCPFSSSTRNIALGNGSTTVPSTRIVSSLGLASALSSRAAREACAPKPTCSRAWEGRREDARPQRAELQGYTNGLIRPKSPGAGRRPGSAGEPGGDRDGGYAGARDGGDPHDPVAGLHPRLERGRARPEPRAAASTAAVVGAHARAAPAAATEPAAAATPAAVVLGVADATFAALARVAGRRGRVAIRGGTACRLGACATAGRAARALLTGRAFEATPVTALTERWAALEVATAAAAATGDDDAVREAVPTLADVGRASAATTGIRDSGAPVAAAVEATRAVGRQRARRHVTAAAVVTFVGGRHVR